MPRELLGVQSEDHCERLPMGRLRVRLVTEELVQNVISKKRLLRMEFGMQRRLPKKQLKKLTQYVVATAGGSMFDCNDRRRVQKKIQEIHEDLWKWKRSRKRQPVPEEVSEPAMI